MRPGETVEARAGVDTDNDGKMPPVDRESAGNAGATGGDEVVADSDDNKVPDGAGGLLDEDVEMIDLSGARELANQVTRAIEGEDHPRAWFKVWLPDGKVGLVAIGLDTTVGAVNERLAQVFGQRAYFLGYRVVTGLTISARLSLTMRQLDDMDLQLGIGSFANDCYGE